MWLYIPSKSAPEWECSVKDCEPGSATWASRLAPSATSSGKHTPPASWQRGSKKAAWMQHLSGPTFAPLTLQHGAEQWIASLLASRARTSALPDGGPGLTVPEVACFSTSSTLPTLAVRGASFWRTSQASLLPPPPLWTKPKANSSSARPPESWENWPTAGGMRNGSLFQHPTWVPAMGGHGGFAGHGDVWRTPVSTEHQNDRKGDKAMLRESQRPGAQITVAMQVRMWLTPNVPNGGRSVPEALVQSKGTTEDGEKRTVGLESQTRYWATPTTNEHTGAGAGPNKTGAANLRTQVDTWPTPAARDHRSELAGEGFVTSRLNETRGQTLSFMAVHSSHQAQATRDGPESLPPNPGLPQPSTKRLNPYFGENLMGWRAGWTSTTVRPGSGALETELWRSALQQQLSCFFDGLDS